MVEWTIPGKHVHINMFLIFMGVKIQLFEVGAYRSDFCLWEWIESEVYRAKVNTRDELVARIMNRAALIKQESPDDLRRATRTVAKRVEKCIEV